MQATSKVRAAAACKNITCTARSVGHGYSRGCGVYLKSGCVGGALERMTTTAAQSHLIISWIMQGFVRDTWLEFYAKVVMMLLLLMLLVFFFFFFYQPPTLWGFCYCCNFCCSRQWCCYCRCSMLLYNCTLLLGAAINRKLQILNSKHFPRCPF